MILKQELTARSAVVVGFLAAAVWLLLALVSGSADVWTVVILPVLFGLAAWLLRVGWVCAKRARRLRTLTELSSAVEPSSREWAWFERAWLTTTRLDKVARRALAKPLARRLREQVEATARELYALAGYASELTRTMNLIDGARLADEATQLRVRQAGADRDAAAAVERSLNAVSDTQAVLDRLAAAREVAMARLAAGTHALEGLHARTLELGVVLNSSPSPLPDALDDLMIELEGLRQGMSEAAEISRTALGNSAGLPDTWSGRPTGAIHKGSLVDPVRTAETAEAEFGSKGKNRPTATTPTENEPPSGSSR